MADPIAPETPIIAAASRRAAWIDHARGIAIILVVYGHCFRGLRSATLIDSPALSTLDYLIYGFHMPLFFFISGVLGVRTARQGGRPFWRRLRTIAWPYVFWMSFELALLSSLGNLTNIGTFSFGVNTYLYEPVSPFWFLYAVLCCVAFVHILVRWGVWVPLLVAVPIFVAGQFAPTELGQQVTWGLLYYSAGTAGAALVRGLAFERIVASPMLIAGSALAAVGLGLALNGAGVGNQWAVPVAVLGTLAVFGAAQHLARWSGRWPSLRLVAYLGQISLTVLVVHILGTAGARIALVRIIGAHAPAALYIAGGMVAGLGLPIALQLVAMRLGVAGWLGLPDIPARPQPARPVSFAPVPDAVQRAPDDRAA